MFCRPKRSVVLSADKISCEKKKARKEASPKTPTKKASPKAIKRLTDGLERTNQKIAERAKLRAQPYESKYIPVFYETQTSDKSMYWCLLHAIHNVLGSADITVQDVEKSRTDPRRAKRPSGGPTGFWDETFFLRFLQQQCELNIEVIRLPGHSGPASKVTEFTTQCPDWKDNRYFVLLRYNHKHPKKGGGYPVDKITIAGHAVAIVDGHVLDSDADFDGKYYPLEEYPYNDTIYAIYKITKRIRVSACTVV